MTAFPQIATDYILQQIYSMTDVAEHFTYSHHQTDISETLYKALDTKQLEDAIFDKSLDTKPHPHPYGLLFYRQVFHQELASDDDFVEALVRKNINQDHYFRDVEKVVRISFYELVQEKNLGNAISNAQAFKAAVAHAALFTRLYFRSVSIATTVVRMIDGEAEDAAWMERLHAALWAVDLAGIYTGALLDIDFRSALLVDTQLGLYSCDYSIEQVNSIFESGFHLARHITTQIISDMEGLGVDRSQLTRILSDELEAMGRMQRGQGLVDNIDDIEHIGLLVRHAVEEYEPELLNNLNLKCAEIRLNQERANMAMQQALAVKPGKRKQAEKPEKQATDEPPAAKPLETKTGGESKAKLRDKEVEQGKQVIQEPVKEQAQTKAPVAKEQQKQATAIMSGLAQMADHMGENTNRTVITEGKKIIDYLRRMQFGEGHEQEDGLEVGSGKKDDASSGGSGDKQDHDVPDLEDMQFEVRIDGEEKKKRRLKDILSALRNGRSVTFASQMQAKTFLKATSTLLNGKQPGFTLSQIRFMNRGMLTTAAEDILADMALDFEFQNQLLGQKQKKQDQQAQVLDQHSDQRHAYDHSMHDAQHVEGGKKAGKFKEGGEEAEKLR